MKKLPSNLEKLPLNEKLPFLTYEKLPFNESYHLPYSFKQKLPLNEFYPFKT
jgi:hypothetical protein